MSRIDEIKDRIENYKSEYLPFFNSNGDMREWHSMFEDIQYLLSRLEIAEKALEKAGEKLAHISSKDYINGQLRYEAATIMQNALQQLRS